MSLCRVMFTLIWQHSVSGDPVALRGKERVTLFPIVITIQLTWPKGDTQSEKSHSISYRDKKDEKRRRRR